MRRVPQRLQRAMLVALAVVAAVSVGRSVPALGQSGGRVALSTSAHTLKTVFLIVMENHDWSAIKGNDEAPYINHTLLPLASRANQYYNPPQLHPSLPNYLWLEAGSNFGIFDDNPPSAHTLSTQRHLAALMDRAHVSWRAYEEDISGKNCPTSDTGLYAVRHDPFVYFRSVTHNSAYCVSHIVPYSRLAGDLRSNHVARYNFITPNVCDDMHSLCSSTQGPVKQGDLWLSHAVPRILGSRAYKRGGVLFITWDEGEGGDGPIGMIVLSGDAKGHGYANTIHYTHSSTLKTIEEIFGLHPLLGDAAAGHTNDLHNLFVKFP